MTDFIPPPAPRPTVTYANCTVADHVGYRPLHLDLHLPAGHGPFPVVLWVHGGGFFTGSRVWMPDSVAPYRFHERLLARGYAVADVDYRLALEAQFPAQLVDVQAAIRWLRHYADQLKLDPNRFAALGESAGGFLVALAGLVGEGDTALQAVINWYGAVDLEVFEREDEEGGPDPITVLFGGPIKGRREFVRWGNPQSRVHAGAPPFLSIHGTADTQLPFSQSEGFTRVLREHGVRAELITVPGADHCFVGHDDIGGLIEAGADFLDDVFKAG
ncbi:alpha/beta hydrolase [Catellatospora tritici]|uniref:alpha/beta hydrolase n=1 Tax=Catellatospora tritici TaxID=2851566 RepID=UPI001C2DCEEE|nr:alpha/beta hydrolase [Catellatospora tritici]MBV1853883.1 alpha/beta hydrolase [Catellatospora tritici]